MIPFSVAKFAAEKLAPHVKKMDEDGFMPENVIQMLFENGVSSCWIYKLLHHVKCCIPLPPPQCKIMF